MLSIFNAFAMGIMGKILESSYLEIFKFKDTNYPVHPC